MHANTARRTGIIERSKPQHLLYMSRGKYVKSDAQCLSRHIALIRRVCARRSPAKCGSNHRPPGGPSLDSRSMGVKYYTHFVLTGEAAAGSDQEFSGVVEVNQATDQRYETKEIEALLARNFDLRSSDVRLINWARLQ